MSTTNTPPGQDPTLGALVNDLTTRLPELIRSEIRLAQAEMAEKGKRAGIGIGMFSVAGLLAFFGLAVLIATAILGLAEALAPWLAALIVGAVYGAIAGILALRGKQQVAQATPPVPEQAVETTKEDLEWMKARAKAGRNN